MESDLFNITMDFKNKNNAIRVNGIYFQIDMLFKQPSL